MYKERTKTMEFEYILACMPKQVKPIVSEKVTKLYAKSIIQLLKDQGYQTKLKHPYSEFMSATKSIVFTHPDKEYPIYKLWIVVP